uniref:Nanos C2HC-type zinc finger 1 n=1 Tax=Dromaius novaehollandiae TaxID=8790 RepID=A0A8C4JWW2_DRONO
MALGGGIQPSHTAGGVRTTPCQPRGAGWHHVLVSTAAAPWLSRCIRCKERLHPVSPYTHTVPPPGCRGWSPSAPGASHPFPGRGGPAAVVFGCSGEHPGREGSPHAWGGLVVAGRLPAHPRAAARLLKPELQVCVFCRNNKEAVALYTTHILKGPDGRVLCPVLRRYTCPLCGASGDNAHTIKYCPLSKMQAARQLKHARTALGKKVR